MKIEKTPLYDITAVVNPRLATLAPQNNDDDLPPFNQQNLLLFYKKVVRANEGCKIVLVDIRKALRIGYGNSKKAFYCPVAEGHIFFRSITEGVIPVDKVLPVDLPEPGSFGRRSAYGTFSYKTEVTLPQGTHIYMVKRDGIYYWLDYLKGRRPGAFQIFWAAAEEGNFAGIKQTGI